MQWVLFVVGSVVGAIGLVVFAGADGSIKQIQGGLMVLIAAVLIGSAGIIEAINGLRKEVRQLDMRR